MRRSLRVAVFAVGALLILLGILVAFLWAPLIHGHCDREDTVLAKQPDGRTLHYWFEACTTIGTAVEATVELVSPSGRRETVFRFEPADGIFRYKGVEVTGPLLPSAEWTSPHSVKIAIGTVADIQEQKNGIDDISVTYSIGTNLHMERDVSQK